MPPESQDDPIHELRLYRIQPGRMGDIVHRWQDDLHSLFPKHGIRPLGTWTAFSGGKAPLFVYLMGWRNLQQRTQSFAGFVADPAWAEVRNRTNAGSELVERYEILFLRAVRAWQEPSPAELEPEPVFELILQEVAQGQGAGVRSAMLDTAVAAWTEAGAQVCGLFDVMSGYALPAAVFVVAWKSLDQRQRAHDALAVRLAAPRSAAREPLLQRAEQYLMQSVPVQWR
ncbi:MAG: hypothetical protein JWP29_4525 [Rhodoferax sp.]|nr:hypothetical protein [Rhodoferax sp.]